MFAGIDQNGFEDIYRLAEYQELMAELDKWVQGAKGGPGGTRPEYSASDVISGMSENLKSFLAAEGVDIESFTGWNAGVNMLDALKAVQKEYETVDWSAIAPAFQSALKSGFLNGLFPDLDLGDDGKCART